MAQRQTGGPLARGSGLSIAAGRARRHPGVRRPTMRTFKFAPFALFVSVCALTQICDAAQMALKLDGDAGSYFAVPNHPSLAKDLGSTFTVEACINPAVTVEENGLEMMILNKEDSYEIADVTDTFQVAVRPADVGSDTAGWEYWDSG